MGRKLFRGTKSPLEPDFDGVHDMTPARFDILHVIHARYRESGNLLRPNRMRMADVRKRLGLHPSTMTVAIRRLVELGLMTVERCDTDKRKLVLVLTPEGIARIRRAYHLVFTGRSISRRYRAFVAKRVGCRRNRAAAIDDELDELWFYDLVLLSQHIGDRSDTIYRCRWQTD